jgi:uncharacterized protein YndB with AHSA1/START domain
MSAAQMDTNASATADREIVLTRLIDAPRELVFRAYTEPEHIVHWFGPDGFTITMLEMDARPGGKWRFIMHGPDGTDYDNRVVYREVAAPERLVFDHGHDVDDDPTAFHVTVTFADEGGRTRVTSRMVFPTAEQREGAVRYGAQELGNQTFGKLAAYVERMRG